MGSQISLITLHILLVGSGSTGAVIASRLSEDPTVSVLLVEAGGSELNNDNIRVPLMVGALQGSNEDWGYYSIPQKYSHKAMNDQVPYFATSYASSKLYISATLSTIPCPFRQISTVHRTWLCEFVMESALALRIFFYILSI